MSSRQLKHITLALCLLPLAWLVWASFADRLGANPAEALIRELGNWGLYLLLATLSCTPLRRWLGWNGALAIRKTLGLAAFAYASLHLLAYLIFEHGFDWPGVWADIIDRPYITLGFSAFLPLLALAITSTRRLKQWLGGRRWQRLHRLIYPLTALVLAHYYLMLKADKGPVLIPALLFTALMLLRLPRR